MHHINSLCHPLGLPEARPPTKGSPPSHRCIRTSNGHSSSQGHGLFNTLAFLKKQLHACFFSKQGPWHGCLEPDLARPCPCCMWILYPMADQSTIPRSRLGRRAGSTGIYPSTVSVKCPSSPSAAHMYCDCGRPAPSSCATLCVSNKR